MPLEITIKGRIEDYYIHPNQLQDGFHSAMRKTMKQMRDDMIRKHLSGPSTSGDTLRRRTGQLAKSWSQRVNVEVGSNSIAYSISNSLPYAAVHEFGTSRPIRPKNAAMLAIPLPPILTPTGVIKHIYGGDIRTAIEKLNAFPITSRKGNKLFATRAFTPDGEDAGIVPIILRRHQVTLPPREFVKKTLDRWADRIPEAVGDMVERVWQRSE